MVDMQELIARLEAAAAGSRELDALVWCALCPGGAAYDRDTHRVSYPDKSYALISEFQAVTTSLDAALALAERIWTEPKVSVWRDRQSAPGWSASVSIGQPYQSVFAPCAALALCISILRAIQHGYEGAESGEVSPNLKAKAQGEGGHG